jgi:AcrR family transcriptional regulator
MGGLPRAYRSPVRAAHANGTRGRIVEAAHQLLKTTRPVDLSYADVAAAAAVSARTVYRCFPRAEDLFAAVSKRILARTFDRPDPDRWGLPELIGALERSFAQLEADPALFRVLFAVPSRSTLDQPTTFARVFGAQVEHLSAADRRSVFALIDLLGSPYAWDVMHFNWDLGVKRSVRATLVAVQALLDYLEREPAALCPDSPAPKLARPGEMR